MSVALLAELPSEEALRRAIGKVREIGYGGPLDAFTPYAIAGIEDDLGMRRPLVTGAVLAVMFVGGAFGYLLQRWCNVIAYAIDVGGHPDEATPAFVIITFETGVLLAFIAGLTLFFTTARLPSLYQPLFEIEGIERATLDRFWLAIDTAHATFDRDRVIRELREVGAERFETITQDGVP